MKREFLTGLELPEETVEKIMAEHGKTIGKTSQELEEVKKNNDTLNEQLKQRDSDLENLKKTSQLSEEQENKFKELQGKYESEKQEWEEKLQKNAFESALEIEVAKSGTKDPIALKAHLNDFLQEAKFEKGSIVGLSDHIKSKLDGELSYLKGESKPTGDRLNNPPKNELSKEEQIKAQLYGNKGE